MEGTVGDFQAQIVRHQFSVRNGFPLIGLLQPCDHFPTMAGLATSGTHVPNENFLDKKNRNSRESGTHFSPFDSSDSLMTKMQ